MMKKFGQNSDNLIGGIRVVPKRRSWFKRIGIVAAVLAAVAGVFVIGFGTGFLQFRHMATTANRDIGRIVSPNGISEAGYIRLGHARQWITIRGQDRDAPILLFLHGGPGGAVSSVAYSFERPWEDYFVVVQWDQRGAGRSTIDGAALKGTMTKEQMVSDTVELIAQLNRRFGRKVVVFAQSWGTILGAEVAKRRPDLIAAYVATGQVTDWRQNFEESRRLAMEEARQTHDTARYARLAALGPLPNMREGMGKYQAWIDAVQSDITGSGHSWHNFRGPGGWSSRSVAMFAMSPDVSDRDLVNTILGRGRLPFDGNDEILKSIDDWTLEKSVGATLDVPVVMIEGRYDWQAPVTLARAYFDKLCAPAKIWVDMPHSAHAMLGEEPGRLSQALVDTVLPLTQGQYPVGAERCLSGDGRGAVRPM
jgi:pimeloyl-ACP methyl ester carboxylesterase